MSDQSTLNSLDYYARHGAALFPIRAGSKAPTGIVGSFALDCSTDPATWRTWQNENPGCNWGVVAGPSRWIIADVDISEIGRDAAWKLWADWWQSQKLAVPPPHCQSARGGWHTYLALPAGVDSAALRQLALIGPSGGSKKAIVDLRVGNGFTVAAGSYYDGTARQEASGPYTLMSNAPPHPCPPALIQHVTRRATTATNSTALGTRDRGDVAALLNWLNERGAFATYEDWVGVGMALKLDFGDSGLELWRLTHNASVTADVEQTKWESFSANHTPGAQTLQTWLQKANQQGWRGQVRKSAAALFDGVAAIAHAAGATLPGQAPSQAMPMMAGQQVLTDLGQKRLDEFLSATADAPARPAGSDYPTLPDSLNGHGLYVPLTDALSRVFALAEIKPWKKSRINTAAAVLYLVHADTWDAARRRLHALGVTTDDRKIKLEAEAISEEVERVFVTNDGWHYDSKGLPEADNSDNVAVLCGVLNIEVRWNAWLERMEVRGGLPGASGSIHYPDWTYIDDSVVAKLRTRANRTKTRFRPGKDFFWESLISLAYTNTYDPALAHLTHLANEWDGTPRLMTWLSHVCGVECDPYHQAVSRNIIGGMVRRIREPGCKHDTMPVFYGYQGSGKSTLGAVIGDMGQSTLSQILSGQCQWFTDTIQLGDEAKELVLALGGICVAEIGEMGMRGSANSAHVKAMISRQVDRGRTAYARSVTDRPRRNIFIGTTNDDEPLTDPTGNRRFLPVKVEREIDLEWLSANVRQIVGEAAALHSRGVSFEIPRSVWADAAERQDAARATTPVEVLLHDWLGPSEYIGPVSYITAADLEWLAELAGWRHGGAHGQRSSVMKRLKFAQESVMFGGKRVRIWARKPAEVRPADVVKTGVRFVVVVGSDGRPNVTIRSGSAAL